MLIRFYVVVVTVVAIDGVLVLVAEGFAHSRVDEKLDVVDKVAGVKEVGVVDVALEPR